MISAGEASGDLHASNLVTAYGELGGEASFWGMGGPKLNAAGSELLVDSRDLAYIGFVDVILHYRKIVRELHRLRDAMRERRPDLVVLVDYPGFNMKLAHCAKSLGIPVLYYISPQVWAWRPQRINEIGRVVDMMAVLFPFEADIYRAARVPVRFIGHPLVDTVTVNTERSALHQQLGLRKGRPTVGFLPGSRHGEVSLILPILARAAKQLREQLGPVNCLVPVAHTLDPGKVQAIAESMHADLITVQGRTYDVINACDAIATSSGTATLETAILGVPMTIVYRVGRLNYYLLKRLVTVDNIGLANIVAGRRIVREFIQQQARPADIAAELVRLLQDKGYAERMRHDLAEVKQRLGTGGANRRIAELVAELLAA
jgi:lipid-A-disaccharide synthase